MLVDGDAAGRLYVRRALNVILIVDIALLAPFRGRGIGTAILRDLCDEADHHGHVISLHVSTTNRARHLYARMGFRQIDDGSDASMYVPMTRPPRT